MSTWNHLTQGVSINIMMLWMVFLMGFLSFFLSTIISKGIELFF